MPATNVISNLSTQTTVPEALRDIKPPIVIPPGWRWAAIAVGAAILCGLLYWAFKTWQKSRAVALSVPPVPAHIRARQSLEEALALIGQPQPFCFRVSDALRIYLEERFNLHAPERTTEEFLVELASSPELSTDQKMRLGEFLQQCDLVKFARHAPGEPELRELHGAALRLVDETEPKEIAPA